MLDPDIEERRRKKNLHKNIEKKSGKEEQTRIVYKAIDHLNKMLNYTECLKTPMQKKIYVEVVFKNTFANFIYSSFKKCKILKIYIQCVP